MTVSVMWFFLAVPWVGLQCVIVVFPDHTHFLFYGRKTEMLCKVLELIRIADFA